MQMEVRKLTVGYGAAWVLDQVSLQIGAGEFVGIVGCTGCGKTVEIESPSESWLKGISDKYGFTIERHTLEVFGLCEDCRKADK